MGGPGGEEDVRLDVRVGKGLGVEMFPAFGREGWGDWCEKVEEG